MRKQPFRILVVDDSETQALKLCLSLEAAGWQAISAPTAEAALDELSRQPPDLVVLDYYLPGIRGDELCRRIRMNVDTRGIPVLMLTSDESQAAEVRGLECGADDHVAKSVDEEILLLRIRALLRKAQAERSVFWGREAFRQARLLAIDDSPTYLEYLSGELLGEGYQVETAGTAEEGLARLAQQPFDCVLLDLVMPGLDGIEACQRIVELRRTMDNPIVVLMLTAHESRDEMTRGLEAGADDFVGKSSDPEVLKARIRALLRRKFFQEENERILRELKTKELEAVRARADTEAAEVRGALAEQLRVANDELEAANQRLKQTQVQMVHREKMASLGQLVAGIAHEINNPLAFAVTSLFSLGGDIEKTLAPGSLPEAAANRLRRAQQRLGDAQEGLERVRDLVLGLRTFSRLDEGEFKTVDVHESIDSVLMFLRHKMDGSIHLVKSYTGEQRLGCFAGQLNQVLMNVVANAVEAMASGGTLCIATSEEDGMFVITVADTGCGIPEGTRQRIFEPFYTTKPVGAGTGLGLAISYGIVQAHHGTIEVEGREGEGSTFRIRIPLDLERRLRQ